MKKIYALTLSTLLLSSCNLDLIPENALTYTNAFITETDLNTTTSTIHLHLSTIPDLAIGYEIGTIADEIRDGEELRDWSPIAVKRRNPSWTNFYNTIYSSNLLLDNIHRTKNLSEDRKNYHRGQALFAKGLSYFSLSRNFGVAVVTENSERLTAYPLSSMLEVIDASISAAEEGFSILPVHAELKRMSGTPVPNKQFASKGSCAALLAHAYAWKGSLIDLFKLDGDSQEAYRKSIEYASKLIDGTVGNYSLQPNPEELCKALSNPMQENPEEIFVFAFDRYRSEYTVSSNPYSGYVSWPTNKYVLLGDIKFSTNYRLYTSTVEKMYPDAGDQRRQAYFYEWGTPHVVDGQDYAIMNKYRESVYTIDQFDPNGGYYRSLNAHYTFWRLADIILLRAECLAKLGRDGEATRDLNQVRERAGATAFPAPHDGDLKKAIFRERERELLAESDHRYYDILRNNYVSTELRGKFNVLTPAEIRDGALFLPIPVSAYQDKSGQVINTLIYQGKYWSLYM